MAAAAQFRPRRGDELLLAHLSALGEERVPARERLELAVGRELARTLVTGLTRTAGPSGAR